MKISFRTVVSLGLFSLFTLKTSLFLAAEPVAPLAKHVILIGFDGFGSYAMPKAEMPRLSALMREGSSTLEARCVLPSSSAVNWATILMGAGPELHGYTEWNTVTPNPPSRVIGRYGLFPGIFGLLRDYRPDAETGVVYQWAGIQHLIEKSAITFTKKTETPAETASAFADYIVAKKPTLAFVHIDDPDHIGHQDGHNTPAYYENLKACDALLGEILDAITRAGIENETIIIVTSDHGGLDKGHGGRTLAEMQVPWVIRGPGIRKNLKIKSSVVLYDTAATIARILGLPPLQVWTGRPVNEVFESPAK